MASDVQSFVLLSASPYRQHHDVDRPYVPLSTSPIHIDTTPLLYQPSGRTKQRKRKLAFVEIENDDNDEYNDGHPRHASFNCCASLSVYPSPPSTSAKLKGTVCLPDVHDISETQVEEMILPLDPDHKRMTINCRQHAPPSPPPTLYTRAHDLPYEHEQCRLDDRIYPSLPTPVSPDGDTRPWYEPLSHDDNAVNETGVWASSIQYHHASSEPQSDDDVITETTSTSNHSLDLQDNYDRDFPPLSSLTGLPSTTDLFDAPLRANVIPINDRSWSTVVSENARISSSRTPQPSGSALAQLPDLFGASSASTAHESLLSTAASSSLFEPAHLLSSSRQSSPEWLRSDSYRRSDADFDPIITPPHLRWSDINSRPLLPRDSIELRVDDDSLSPYSPPPLLRVQYLTQSPVELPQSVLPSTTNEAADDGRGPLEGEDDSMDVDPDPPSLVQFRDSFGEQDKEPPPPESPRHGFFDLPPCSPRHSVDDLPSLPDQLHSPHSPHTSPLDLPSIDNEHDLSPPSSPSRRSLSELPELDVSDPAPAPSSPHSPRLLSLPGADTDDSLLALDDSNTPLSSDDKTSLAPSSSLGIFVPLSVSPSRDPLTLSGEPDLDFPPDALARVDASELAGLLALRRRTWFAERNAKRAELDAADAVRAIAADVRLSPPVPGALDEVDRDRVPVSALGDGDGASGLRRKIQMLEAKRAEARRERKAFKDMGREAQCLLRFALGETVKERASVDGGEKAKTKTKGTAKNMEQLVARMVLKRREIARPLSGRRLGSIERVRSPLVPRDDDDIGDDEDADMDVEG